MCAQETVRKGCGVPAGSVFVMVNFVSATGIARTTVMTTARTEGDGDRERRTQRIIGSIREDLREISLFVRRRAGAAPRDLARANDSRGTMQLPGCIVSVRRTGLCRGLRNELSDPLRMIR